MSQPSTPQSAPTNPLTSTSACLICRQPSVSSAEPNTPPLPLAAMQPHGAHGDHPYVPAEHFITWTCAHGHPMRPLYALKLDHNIQVCQGCGYLYEVVQTAPDGWMAVGVG